MVDRTTDALEQTVLGTAQSFAVLGASTVTNIGATTVYGNLGVDPGLAITGFPPGIVTGGTVHAGDAVALQARNDATTAYITLAGLAPTLDLSGQDLGGRTLTAGVYTFSSSAQLTGALTLDAEGNPHAAFVFQMASTLTTASNSSILVINGAQDCNIFWQVGSSATLGTTTTFRGNIIALTSITLNTGATVSGRTLARNAAVTMDSNHVSSLACSTPVADAGVDASDGASSGQDGGSDVGPDSSSVAESGIDSSSGGGDAALDSGAAETSSASEAGEAGGPLCCGGVLCGTSCTALTGDIANCGSCGNACGSDQFCAAGACVTCSSVCAGQCVYLPADDANCGSCGHACLGSEVCTGGACVPCPMVCGGACVDLGSDPANCGSCGNACPASAVCTGGACTSCSSLCGGACVDLSSDPAHCGSCGQSCAPGESCKSGSCVCQ